MRMQVSAVALAAALFAVPQAAHAQSLGVDVNSNGGGGLGVDVSIGGSDGINVDAGLGGSDSGSGVDAGVSVGGSSGLDVDVGAGVSGDSGIDVDAGVDLGGSSGVGVNAGVDVGGDSGLGVDASVNVGGGSTGSGTAPTGPNGGALIDLDAAVNLGGGSAASTPERAPQTPAAPAATPLIGTGISLSALNETARVDAIADLLDGSTIAGIDLDAVVDDRNVSVISLSELLGEDGLDQVNELLAENAEGRQDILDAVAGSEVLSSVLGNQGVDLSDVVAIQVRGDGATEVLVLSDVVEVAIGGNTRDTPSAGNGLAGSDLSNLAELDVALLSDDEVTQIDLTLLPTEEQRLTAVLRLLGNDNSEGGAEDESPSTNGAVHIVDLDALLNDNSLAQVDVLTGSNEGDLVLTADLLDQLDTLGLSPETVVAVRTGSDGKTGLFINSRLGGSGNTQTAQAPLLEVDLGVGTDSDPDTGTSTDADGSGTGSGTDTNNGGGSNEDTGGDTDEAGNGSGSSDNGSGGSGNSGASGSEPGGGVSTDGDLAGTGTNLAAVPGAAPQLFAQLGCNAGVAALNKGEAANPAQIASARSLELVQVIGCAGDLAPADVERLRASIEANDQLAKTLQGVGVMLDEVVGATADDGIVTLFVEQQIG